MTLREKYAANRALADLKTAVWRENRERKGWFRVHFLPAAVYTAAGLICLAAARLLVVNPLRETAGQPKEQTYYTASAAFLNGDLDQATETVIRLLRKNPGSSAANPLMAKIHLARGQRQAAADCLRTARETALECQEIDGWIAGLESPPFPPPASH
ncbi:MAG: hypothetical protein V4726_02970 [Verrucomicrobiota bacterium]